MSEQNMQNENEMQEWLPPLVDFNDYSGWDDFLEAIYRIYVEDFIHNRFSIDGVPVKTRREPQSRGKDKAFWHICGEDDGQSPTGTFARHERIRWPKAIILNRNDVRIKMWMDDCYKGSNGGLRVSIWFDDEYLVVLEPRPGYVLFITAYCTDIPHKRRTLEKRFQRYGKDGVEFVVPGKTETATEVDP